MTVREFKNSKVYKKASAVSFFDINGVDISNKMPIILDLLQVIGTAHRPNGIIEVDVDYIE